MIEAVADAGVHPAHRRRRRAHGRRRAARCSTPAPTRSASTPRRCSNPQLVERRVRHATARSASSWRSTRSSRRPGAWEVYTHGGRKPTGLDAVDWAREMAARGAGEILLTSMDRDGTRERLRPRADARGRRRGRRAGDRVAAASARSSTWPTASERAAPTRCSRRQHLPLRRVHRRARPRQLHGRRAASR